MPADPAKAHVNRFPKYSCEGGVPTLLEAAVWLLGTGNLDTGNRQWSIYTYKLQLTASLQVDSSGLESPNPRNPLDASKHFRQLRTDNRSVIVARPRLQVDLDTRRRERGHQHRGVHKARAAPYLTRRHLRTRNTQKSIKGFQGFEYSMSLGNMLAVADTSQALGHSLIAFTWLEVFESP